MNTSHLQNEQDLTLHDKSPRPHRCRASALESKTSSSILHPKTLMTRSLLLPVVAFVACSLAIVSHAEVQSPATDGTHSHAAVQFDLRSAGSGNWSDAKTWTPARVPKAGDRVLVSRGTRVVYDAVNKDVVRLVQVVGTLVFARDRNTELNVGVLKVQNSDACSETGFSCDLAGVNVAGEPRAGAMPTLEIGTLAEPLPRDVTARIRLHHVLGLDPKDGPALVCCSARMELHGAPMSRTWVKLGADAAAGAKSLTLAEPVEGWRVGDEIIVTPSKRHQRRGAYHDGDPTTLGTEERRIVRIEGATLELDQPLAEERSGSGEFRCEVANLSRNVIVESADPDGVRGHTMYHAYSRGGISYARFAHLGKKGVLGRYAIHFHLVGDTMRGSQVLGVAIVDSHNRWVTIHGTEYLIVRDCVGYRSLGHGFFMEDGTEIYNLLEHNLAVQADRAKPLPKQALPFDDNGGAGFWWANGRNTFVRNVTCQNDAYGYRYDMRNSKYFSSTLPITMPDGTTRKVDVRTIPNWRFDDNESHCDDGAGMIIACNGDAQPDTTIRDQQMLDKVKAVDWTGPDARHPHMLRNLKVWETHYAFRPQSPSMLIDGLRIFRTVYGVYRPAFDNHEYRNVHLTRAGGEPFNRGMDDASSQVGVITVDGLKVDDFSKSSSRVTPIVQMSDNNLSGRAASHFRNVSFTPVDGRGSMFNRGGQTRGPQFVEGGVPYFVHDYYGPGRHAKIVSRTAKPILADGNKYHEEAPLTGDEAVVAEVSSLTWPKVLDPIDDLPPATIITAMRRTGEKLVVSGVTHDNGEIKSVTLNGLAAKFTSNRGGIANWSIELPPPTDGIVSAHATDDAGNVEKTAHKLRVDL